MHVVSVFIVMYGVWILLSGQLTAMHLGAGLVCSLIVTYLAVRKGIADAEGHPVQLLGTAFVYWPWLGWQIVLANLDVLWRVWHPRLPISPRMVKVPNRIKNDLTKVIYANSITLTPGTVTVSVDKDHFLVHSLTEEGVRSLLTGEMEKRVRRMEEAG